MIELWRWVMVGSERIDVTAADHVGSDRGPAGWIAAAQPFSPKLTAVLRRRRVSTRLPRAPSLPVRCRSRLADRGCR